MFGGERPKLFRQRETRLQDKSAKDATRGGEGARRKERLTRSAGCGKLNDQPAFMPTRHPPAGGWAESESHKSTQVLTRCLWKEAEFGTPVGIAGIGGARFVSEPCPSHVETLLPPSTGLSGVFCSCLSCCYPELDRENVPGIHEADNSKHTFARRTYRLEPPWSALPRENGTPSTAQAATAAAGRITAHSPESALHGAAQQWDVAAAPKELNILDVLGRQPRRAQRLPARRKHPFGDPCAGLLDFLSSERHPAQGWISLRKRGQHPDGRKMIVV